MLFREAENPKELNASVKIVESLKLHATPLGHVELVFAFENLDVLIEICRKQKFVVSFASCVYADPFCGLPICVFVCLFCLFVCSVKNVLDAKCLGLFRELERAKGSRCSCRTHPKNLSSSFQRKTAELSHQRSASFAKTL